MSKMAEMAQTIEELCTAAASMKIFSTKERSAKQWKAQL